MKIFIADSYEAMSKQAANDLVSLLQPTANPLISPASGDSPAGMYKELAAKAKNDELNVFNWHFVALDEWVGMNGTDEGSCRYHLDQQLFNPLQVAADRICFFDGRSHNLQIECEQAEQFIQDRSGIDAAIVGLGLNGHIGMNEPGTPVTIRSHIGQLDALTVKVGQKYFKKEQPLSEGITLGLANILEARYVFLLVSGSKKANIVKLALEEDITEQLPATFLRNHPGFRIYLDKEAAASLQQDNLWRTAK